MKAAAIILAFFAGAAISPALLTGAFGPQGSALAASGALYVALPAAVALVLAIAGTFARKPTK